MSNMKTTSTSTITTTTTNHGDKIVSELSHPHRHRFWKNVKKRVRRQSFLVWFIVLFSLFVMGLIVYVSYEGERDIGPPLLFQVHLSFGTNPTEMMVTCHTNTALDAPLTITYGISSKHLSDTAKMVVNKLESINLFTYRALLTGLKQETVYFYQVRGKLIRSEVFEFSTAKLANPTILIYGDLGLENGRSLPYLIREVSNGENDDDDDDTLNQQIKAIFHLGDIGINLHTNCGEQEKSFLTKLEPIATRVPYQTCPGQWESFDNFSHYDARFTMIRGSKLAKNSGGSPSENAVHSLMNNHYYSLNIGPVHVVVFSTEFYYNTDNFGWNQIEKQYEFLERDLRRANRNRHHQPWIITMAHRPMYCLKLSEDDRSCHNRTLERKSIRKGVYLKKDDEESSSIHSRLFGLEELFYWYGVDLQFYAHDHFYLRTYPIYKHRMRINPENNNDERLYRNPKAPIHIVTGIAGSAEHSSKMNDIPEWIAFYSREYSYTRLKILGRQHLLLEQVSVEKNGSLVDSVTITKDKPKPAWLDEDEEEDKRRKKKRKRRKRRKK